MAQRRLLKFFLSLVVLFVVVGVVAVIGAWMLVSRGPSVPRQLDADSAHRR